MDLHSRSEPNSFESNFTNNIFKGKIDRNVDYLELMQDSTVAFQEWHEIVEKPEIQKGFDANRNLKCTSEVLISKGNSINKLNEESVSDEQSFYDEIKVLDEDLLAAADCVYSNLGSDPSTELLVEINSYPSIVKDNFKSYDKSVVPLPSAGNVNSSFYNEFSIRNTGNFGTVIRRNLSDRYALQFLPCNLFLSNFFKFTLPIRKLCVPLLLTDLNIGSALNKKISCSLDFLLPKICIPKIANSISACGNVPHNEYLPLKSYESKRSIKSCDKDKVSVIANRIESVQNTCATLELRMLNLAEPNILFNVSNEKITHDNFATAAFNKCSAGSEKTETVNRKVKWCINSREITRENSSISTLGGIKNCSKTEEKNTQASRREVMFCENNDVGLKRSLRKHTNAKETAVIIQKITPALNDERSVQIISFIPTSNTKNYNKDKENATVTSSNGDKQLPLAKVKKVPFSDVNFKNVVRKTETKDKTDSSNNIRTVNIKRRIPAAFSKELPPVTKKPCASKPKAPQQHTLVSDSKKQSAPDFDSCKTVGDSKKRSAPDFDSYKTNEIKKSRVEVLKTSTTSAETERVRTIGVDEQRDNNDPKWSSLRINKPSDALGVLKDQWQIRQVSNPHKDLTVRVRRSAQTDEKRKPPPATQRADTRCVAIFDKQVRSTDVEIERVNRRLGQLYRSYHDFYFDFHKVCRINEEVDACRREKERLENEYANLCDARGEINGFYRFYATALSSSNAEYISQYQRNENDRLRNVIQRYDTFYKSRE